MLSAKTVKKLLTRAITVRVIIKITKNDRYKVLTKLHRVKDFIEMYLS